MCERLNNDGEKTRSTKQTLFLPTRVILTVAHRFPYFFFFCLLRSVVLPCLCHSQNYTISRKDYTIVSVSLSRSLSLSLSLSLFKVKQEQDCCHSRKTICLLFRFVFFTSSENNKVVSLIGCVCVCMCVHVCARVRVCFVTLIQS